MYSICSFWYMLVNFVPSFYNVGMLFLCFLVFFLTAYDSQGTQCLALSLAGMQKRLHLLTLYIYIIGIKIRVLANGSGDRGSIPYHNFNKWYSMVPYKVQIKGTWSIQVKGVGHFPTSPYSSY